MNHLLFTLIIIKIALTLSLVFETPLKTLAITALDRLKQGRSRTISRTLKGILLAAFVSTIYPIMKAYYGSVGVDSVNPVDEVLVANKMLQASLMGFLLCLSMMTEKLHQLVRDHGSLNQLIIAEEKQLAERKRHNAETIKALEKGNASLKMLIKKLEYEFERNAKHANTAKAKEMALIKQSEEFELGYDRLLEYNQILQNQLQSINESLLVENPRSGWTRLKSNILGEGLVQFPRGICKSSKSIGELDQQIDVQTFCQSTRFYCSGGHHAVSLPRHRRPIYQQMSLTL